jgi:hypothetical protein
MIGQTTTVWEGPVGSHVRATWPQKSPMWFPEALRVSR